MKTDIQPVVNLSSTAFISLMLLLLCSLNYTFSYADVTAPYLLLASTLLITIFARIKARCTNNPIALNLRLDNISVLFAVFWSLAMLSTVSHSTWTELIANPQIILYIAYLLIYFIAFKSLGGNTDLGKNILLGAAYLSILICFQYWFIFFSEIATYDGKGLMVSSNLLAIYVTMATFILLQFPSKKYWIHYSLIALLIITLVSTGSRSAMIAMVLAGFIIWLLKKGTSIKPRYILFGSAVFLLFSGLLYLLRPDSVRGRILLWELGLSAIDFRHLLFGNGLGFIALRLGDIQGEFYRNKPLADQLLAGDVRTILNEYIRIILEVGMFSLICMIAAVYKATRIFHARNKYYLAGALIVLMVSSLSSYPLASAPISVFMIILLAFAASLSTAPVTSISKTRIIAPIKFMTVNLGIVFTALVLLFYIGSYGFTIFHWKQLNSSLWVQYNEAKFHKEYENLYKTLAYEPTFLTDYGTKLQSLGYYEKAGLLLETATNIQPSSARLVQLGYNYQQLKEFDLAEASYNKAIRILPKAFLPKYMLFDLYRTLKDQEKAKTTAADIAIFPVKIASAEVTSIKKEAIDYLNTNPYAGD
ncbi:MAG: hypothetical protein K0R59_43 [Sphingobacterium sp.]|jgi:tetratricopeptide (TPR) repeat protein|nr:hypothetical protein [Sphingobacterium sp.]